MKCSPVKEEGDGFTAGIDGDGDGDRKGVGLFFLLVGGAVTDAGTTGGDGTAGGGGGGTAGVDICFDSVALTIAGVEADSTYDEKAGISDSFSTVMSIGSPTLTSSPDSINNLATKKSSLVL